MREPTPVVVVVEVEEILCRCLRNSYLLESRVAGGIWVA